MRNQARALAAEFHAHLWVLGGLLIYFTGLAWVAPALDPDLRVQIVPLDGSGTLFVLPLSVAGMYFLAIFSHGLRGDVAARPSIYPARTFTLPVSTATLTAVPMLYGATVMIALWLMIVTFARWPWGVTLPVVWPGLLGAVILNWTQALTWMPYGWRGVRIAAAALALTTLDVIVITAFHYEISEAVMVAFLAPQLPLAYVTARAAVARARRGVVPDWPGVFDVIRPRTTSRIRSPFTSVAAAQAWYEWRRHGWTLPAMVAMVVPCELFLLFVPVIVAPGFLFTTLAFVLVTPPVLAGFVAATVRRVNPHARDSLGLTAFDATRPASTATLVGAKLTMALWSTLAAWGIVAILIPAALQQSGTWELAAERARAVAAQAGAPRACALAALIALGLVASTWKRLTQSLYVGLAGRRWLSIGIALTVLAAVIAIGPAFEVLRRDADARVMLWNNWVWILAALVTLKLIAAALVFARLSNTGLVSPRVLAAGALGWTVTVLALEAGLVWLVNTPFVSRAVLGMAAILAVPLARLAAAPLALTWNRHR